MTGFPDRSHRPQVVRRMLVTPQRQRRLGEQEIRDLISARRSGVTIDALAQRHAIHRTTVMAHLRRVSLSYEWRGPLPSDNPHGFDLLPRDLTVDELASAPVLESLDDLLLDLTDDEDDAFAAALAS